MVDIRWLCCKFKIGRSICRSPFVRPGLQLGPVRFRPAPRPDPADRSPGPFRSRPLFRLYQLSSFRSIRLLLVPVRLFVRSARLLFGSSFGSFSSVRFRLVQFSFGSVFRSSHSGFVRFVFRSVSLQLNLFCARAFSRSGLFILFSRILYTKRGQSQMNFLSKNMSFLIISVSTLNYLPLEHFSPLDFPSIRPSLPNLSPTPLPQPFPGPRPAPHVAHLETKTIPSPRPLRTPPISHPKSPRPTGTKK